MLSALYFSGTAIALILLVTYLRRRDGTFRTRLLLFSVSVVPLGKLIYFPIPGFYGLKIPFLICSIIGLYGILFYRIRYSSARLVLIAFLPAISVVWLQDPTWFLLHDHYPGQTDSVVLRILVFIALVCYSIVISEYVQRTPQLKQEIAQAFIKGTIYASLIGIIIAVGVWTGRLSAEDIFPISVDTHVAYVAGGGFYRFNPGANVNEFSMILAFAILLLRFANYSAFFTRLLFVSFLVLEFATLTRGSWIALLIAIVVAQIGRPRIMQEMPRLLLMGGGITFLFFLIYISSEGVASLIDSRTALQLGVSGEERLELFQNVIDRVGESPFRFIFGFGWATNMYVHDVYLQILYELGLIGLSVMVALGLLLCWRIALIKASLEKVSLLAIVIFIAVAAISHHTLYHVQTWLMLGFVMGATRVAQKQCSPPNSAGNRAAIGGSI